MRPVAVPPRPNLRNFPLPCFCRVLGQQEYGPFAIVCTQQRVKPIGRCGLGPRAPLPVPAGVVACIGIHQLQNPVRVDVDDIILKTMCQSRQGAAAPHTLGLGAFIVVGFGALPDLVHDFGPWKSLGCVVFLEGFHGDEDAIASVNDILVWDFFVLIAITRDGGGRIPVAVRWIVKAGERIVVKILGAEKGPFMEWYSFAKVRFSKELFSVRTVQVCRIGDIALQPVPVN